MTTAIFSRLPATSLVLAGLLILCNGCAPKDAQQKSAPPAVTVAPVEQQQIV
jgi:hypothetical protein